MKKIALFSISILLNFVADAQFERVVPENGYARFLRTLKGDFVLVYNSHNAEFLDKNGTQIKKLNAYNPLGGHYNAFDLVDTSVVFTGWGFSFDGWGWWGTPGFIRINANLQNIGFLNYYNNLNDYEVAEKLSDGGFVEYNTLSWHGFKRKDFSGKLLWEFNIMDMQVRDLASNIALQSIAATNQGLLVVDSSGQSDTLFNNFDFTHIETISFGNLVGSKSDTIYLFDENFQVIQKALILGETVKDMKSMEDRVAVLTESNHVYLYDQDLMLIANFQLDYDHLTFKNIVPDQDGVVLAGDHHFGIFPSGNNAVFVKKFGANGFDPFERRDIGLYFVQPATKTDVWPEAGKFKVSFQDVKFQVFNYSDTVLNSFRANVRFPDLPMEWPLHPNPVPQHFFKQFSNLNLAPGQSTTLSWDEFTATFVEYPSGNNMELCFWSSMPDGKSDINPNNDVACADFFVNDEEQQPEQIGFEVFPNPTTSSCSIFYSLPAVSDSELSIYDAMGRLLHRQQLAEGTNRLVINDLTKGMNLLVLKVNGDVVKTEKLIRE